MRFMCKILISYAVYDYDLHYSGKNVAKSKKSNACSTAIDQIVHNHPNESHRKICIARVIKQHVSNHSYIVLEVFFCNHFQ